MDSTEVIQTLTGLLHDKSLEVDMRVAAADGLGYGGFSNARGSLLKVIEDLHDDSVVRQAATRALGRTLLTSK